MKLDVFRKALAFQVSLSYNEGMTNMILSILGVLLAAISTVIAVDYGGDYYEDVRSEAELAAAYNGWEQVRIAMDAYKSQYLVQADDIATLVSAGLLDEAPRMNSMEFRPSWASYKYNGVWTKGMVYTDVPLNICTEHNVRTGFEDTHTGKPATVTTTSGCYTSSPDADDGIMFDLIDRY